MNKELSTNEKLIANIVSHIIDKSIELRSGTDAEKIEIQENLEKANVSLVLNLNRWINDELDKKIGKNKKQEF